MAATENPFKFNYNLATHTDKHLFRWKNTSKAYTHQANCLYVCFSPSRRVGQIFDRFNLIINKFKPFGQLIRNRQAAGRQSGRNKLTINFQIITNTQQAGRELDGN